MNMKKLISAAVLLAAVGGASAQVYVGGSVGATNVNADCSGTSDCKNNDTGYKLYVGYKLNPVFSVEAGYINFGKPSATAYVYPYGNIKVDLESSAPFVVGAVRGNFTPELSGVARLGLANMETKLKATQVITSASGSDSKSEIKALFGLGLEYAFTKSFSASVEADFSNTTEVISGMGSGSIRMLSIGGQYHF
ncbi:MAG: porin family protein [Burkholderiales bacterium]|nr:MAG: porin family protein [Burkholderiales bacterium]